MEMIKIESGDVNDISFDEFLMKFKLMNNNYRKMHGVAMKRRVHTKNGWRIYKSRRFNRRLKRAGRTYILKPCVIRPVSRLVFNMDEM